MMKRRGAKNKLVSEIQPPSLELPDSGIAVVEKTQEQVLYALLENMCKLTGTHSNAVADRILYQTTGALTWPNPVDVDGRLIVAMSLIGEMAPQNAMEAMLAV